MTNKIEVTNAITIENYVGFYRTGVSTLVVTKDSGEWIAFDLDEWQALKDAGDKLIAENKDG